VHASDVLAAAVGMVTRGGTRGDLALLDQGIALLHRLADAVTGDDEWTRLVLTNRAASRLTPGSTAPPTDRESAGCCAGGS
jgi:hypothetical protein